MLQIYFSASCSLSITNTKTRPSVVHRCTRQQDGQGRRSIIDSVIVSSDLWPVCAGHMGEEGCRGVNRSPPGGELDQVAGERDVTQTINT